MYYVHVYIMHFSMIWFSVYYVSKIHSVEFCSYNLFIFTNIDHYMLWMWYNLRIWFVVDGSESVAPDFFLLPLSTLLFMTPGHECYRYPRTVFFKLWLTLWVIGKFAKRNPNPSFWFCKSSGTLRICMPRKLVGVRLMFCSGICILE